MLGYFWWFSLTLWPSEKCLANYASSSRRPRRPPAQAAHLPKVPSLPTHPNLPTDQSLPTHPNLPAHPNLPTHPDLPAHPNLPKNYTKPNYESRKRETKNSKLRSENRKK